MLEWTIKIIITFFILISIFIFISYLIATCYNIFGNLYPALDNASINMLYFN